ncbi:MAG: hydrolase, partial [Bacteroidia bacterium]|nr:hydrolase [Bacteroidia bacterium]
TELTASFNFDPYKAIDLRFRNSWSVADYSDDIFWILNDDGSRTLFDYDTEANNPNQNFNIWNLDLSFRWRFAPGSEATLLYRNQIFNLDELATLGYGQSLDNLFAQPTQHTISLRITYFIDYNNVKYLFKSS